MARTGRTGRPPGYAPHLDARILPDASVAAVADHGVPVWRVVEVRVGGYWTPGVLSAWRRLSFGWVGRVRWSPGTYGAAWVLYAPWSLRPAVLLHPEPTIRPTVAAGGQAIAGAVRAAPDDTRTAPARRGPGPHRT